MATPLDEILLDTISECITCSICMEIFTEPATLMCGHNYCMKCINDHLDRLPKRKKNCPECRQKLPSNLTLSKNVTVCNIVKVYTDHEQFVSNVKTTEGSETETEILKRKLKFLTAQTNRVQDSSLSTHNCTEDIIQNGPEECETRGKPSHRSRRPDVSPSTSLLAPESEHPNNHQRQQEQVKALVVDDTVPEVTVGVRSGDSLLPIFPPSSSNTKHGAEGCSPCLPVAPNPPPGATFAWLTFSPSLGHKRLAFTNDRVVTKRTQSSSSGRDRFDVSQWMAEQEFSGGRHYWDVDTAGSAGGWAVGVAYAGIGRGDQLGRTAASWCLERRKDTLCFCHGDAEEYLKQPCGPGLVRVVLDMSDGTLCFYSLSVGREEDTLLLLQVEAGFSEPVRPVFWLYGVGQQNALSFPRYQEVLG